MFRELRCLETGNDSIHLVGILTVYSIGREFLTVKIMGKDEKR